jgi:hypothetical protein
MSSIPIPFIVRLSVTLALDGQQATADQREGQQKKEIFQIMLMKPDMKPTFMSYLIDE